MAAYMLFIREGAVFDPAAFETYGRMNRENKHDFKIKPLSIYGQMETLEGEAPDGIVLLEFATPEEAKAWYNSPGYQASAEHRRKSAHYRAILLEGF